MKILIIFFSLFIYFNSVYSSNIINNTNNENIFQIDDEYIKFSVDFLKLNINDEIRFGKYEQDNNELNGKEDIEWIVIDKNENGILLTTKYLIDCKPYNTFHKSVTWEKCSLRNWLNTSFYNDSFSKSEKQFINNTYLINDENPYYKSNKENNTYDKIFILSINEVLNLLYSNEDFLVSKKMGLQFDIRKLCRPTEYAKKNGVRVNISSAIFNGCGNYWLRTQGLYGDRIWYKNVTAKYFQSIITEDGRISPKGTGVHSVDDGVRPCLYININ